MASKLEQIRNNHPTFLSSYWEILQFLIDCLFPYYKTFVFRLRSKLLTQYSLIKKLSCYTNLRIHQIAKAFQICVIVQTPPCWRFRNCLRSQSKDISFKTFYCFLRKIFSLFFFRFVETYKILTLLHLFFRSGKTLENPPQGPAKCSCICGQGCRTKPGLQKNGYTFAPLQTQFFANFRQYFSNFFNNF